MASIFTTLGGSYREILESGSGRDEPREHRRLRRSRLEHPADRRVDQRERLARRHVWWDALESWCPAFVKTEIQSGGNDIGSVRAITLKDGPTFTEELLASDSAARTYRYKIVDSPLPIIEYVSTVKVIGAGNKSSIIWVSSYKRRAEDHTNPETNDQAMLNLVGGLYKACLGNAKTVAEQ